MGVITDTNKVLELSKRIYNNKYESEEVKLEDEDAIKRLCNKIFPDNGDTPSSHDLHSFNNIIVKTATTISEKDVQQLLNYFAEVQSVDFNTSMIKYTKSIPRHIRFKWAAIGSTVSLKRVETGRDEYVQLDFAQTGFQYNYLNGSQNQVEMFRTLVKDVAAARVMLIYDTIMELVQIGATSTGVIPAKQKVAKANVTIGEFDKVANILGRRTGSRPIFIADRELISSFAAKKVTAVSINLPDIFKKDSYEFGLTNLGSADAVPLKNDFTTELGTETPYEVSTGYMLGSASGKKPFYVALAGGLIQDTEKDVEYGRVKMIIRQKLGIDFLYAGNVGVVTDTEVSI